MKAATYVNLVRFHQCAFQSTPPVKAATAEILIKIKHVHISIHAAREGGDLTAAWAQQRHGLKISIHAAREGGDAVIIISVFVLFDFNPRRP